MECCTRNVHESRVVFVATVTFFEQLLNALDEFHNATRTQKLQLNLGNFKHTSKLHRLSLTNENLIFAGGQHLPMFLMAKFLLDLFYGEYFAILQSTHFINMQDWLETFVRMLYIV